MINIDELRLILHINGVDNEYTDDELNQLITYYTNQFNNLISFNYTSSEYVEYYPVLEYTSVLLINHYPIQEISTLTLEEKDYLEHVKYVNPDSGLIYFKESFRGDLHITYKSGWSEEDIEAIITPIITDLIVYGLKYGASGLMSSLSEGDVSVSYDTSSNLFNIQNRINDLNKRFSVKGRMI